MGLKLNVVSIVSVYTYLAAPAWPGLPSEPIAFINPLIIPLAGLLPFGSDLKNPAIMSNTPCMSRRTRPTEIF